MNLFKKDELFSFRILISIFIIVFITYIVGLFLSYGNSSDKTLEIHLAILPVFSGLILFAVTFAYVIITHKILKDNQLQRNRSFIEKMMIEILIPMVEYLDLQIDYFKNIKIINFFSLDWKNSRHFDIKKVIFHFHQEIYYKLFSDQYPSLFKKFEEHEKKSLNFRETLFAVTDKIKNDLQLKKKWNDIISDEIKQGNKDLILSESINKVLTSILHGENYVLPEPFWANHMKDILSDKIAYENDIALIEDYRKEVIEHAKLFKQELMGTIIDQMKTYGIIPTKVGFVSQV